MIDTQPAYPFSIYEHMSTTDDAYAGVLSMSTFLNELKLLIRVFGEHYGERFKLTVAEIQQNVWFKNARKELQDRLGDKQRHVHGRPIWFQDEKRLIAATSTSTMGLQDRALIRVLVHSGARAHDASQILTDLHVEETFYHNGSPAIKLFVPSIKNQRGDVSVTFFIGEPYRDVLAWVRRRRVIFPSSPYLFI